jgi:NAD(P)-dependent dehydrogenase (short-subunit alcohol dehydrogenase family)
MQKDKLLNKQVIVITGGAGLLGRQFCSMVAENGGVAIVADLDIESARRVTDELVAIHPGSAEAENLDIRSMPSVSGLIDALHERYGHIDAIVNNAYPRNRNYGRRFEDVTYDDFCENVSMHLGGYFLVAQQFGLYFKKQGWGNIVSMASVYGVMAPRFEIYEGTSMTMPLEYAAIKSAVIHLTKYMAKYFKGSGVRINCISPGGILDSQSISFLARYAEHCTSKGMLNAKDICGTLLYLLSDMSEFLHGQNIVVDDAFSL